MNLKIKHQCRACDPSDFAHRLQKRSKILYDFVYGLESKIHLCCVIEYVFRSNILNQLVGKEVTPEGFWFNSDHVPCWYHRRKWIEPGRPKWR